MGAAVPVLQTGFDRVAVGILSPDGIDAASIPSTETTVIGTTAVTGVAVIVPGTQYGLAITGVDAAVDQNIDFPRGLRVVVLASQNGGGPAGLIAAIQALPIYVGSYSAGQTIGGEPTIGAVFPDLQTLIGNPNSVTGLAYAKGSPQNYNVLAEIIRHPGNMKFAASNGTESQQTANAGYLHLEWAHGLIVPPNVSAALLVIAYRPYSESQPKAGATRLNGATIRGSIHGYALPQAPSAYQVGTPARTGNIVVPGTLAP